MSSEEICQIAGLQLLIINPQRMAQRALFILTSSLGIMVISNSPLAHSMVLRLGLKVSRT